MNGVVERMAFAFDVTALSSQTAFVWSNEWIARPGITLVDLLLDTRAIVAPSSGISVIPAIQLAQTRTDRPGSGAVITGTAASTETLTKYQASLASSLDQLYFRLGVGYSLSSGSFARCSGLVYPSYRISGRTMAPEEIVMHPMNPKATWLIFPLGGGRPIPTIGVSKVLFAVHGMANLTSTMEYAIYARGFNDLHSRGTWSQIGSAQNPGTGGFAFNTGEVAFTGTITLSDFMWMELALGVRKQADGDDPSRCIFHVVPALIYA